MKIAIFCAGEPRHIHFANKICNCLPVSRIFIEQVPSIYDDARLKREAEFFLKTAKPHFDKNVLVYKVTDINCDGIATYLSHEDNILVCTFGCSIIKLDNAFRKGIIILNLHSGILPQYRGVHCVFWALYNREPDMLGGSIHLINKKIDAGGVMARVFPSISADDNEESLFNKTIMLGVEEFVRVATFIYEHGTPFAKPQSRLGRLYLAKDRTKRCESELNDMLQGGLLSALHRKERIERFYEKMEKGKELRSSGKMAA